MSDQSQDDLISAIEPSTTATTTETTDTIKTTENNIQSNVEESKVVEEKFEVKVERNDIESSLVANDLSYCEICSKEFTSKKLLRSHLLVHVGQPRVLLNRITSIVKPVVVVKKKHVAETTYRLDQETKGSLKLTLKKQSSNDSLKLTLKKSSISQDFTVVSKNINNFEYYYKNEVAGTANDADKSSTDNNDHIGEHNDNLTTSDQNEAIDDCCETNDDESNHTVKDGEQPTSMDINEGDSGVGSDTVNASEKEDQTFEDRMIVERSEDTDKILADCEESDEIEATCRETIESLKKLGEDTRSADDNPIDNINRFERSTDETSAMIQQLTENASISLIPKSTSSCLAESGKERSPLDKNESLDSPNSNNNLSLECSWKKLSTDNDSTNRNNKENNPIDEEKSVERVEDSLDQPDQNTGSLLQNFLIEYQRQNDNETSLSNSLQQQEQQHQNCETEYVSIEKLADTVKTCRVCNEKFTDIGELEKHKTEASHFQCGIPDCVNLIFNSRKEVVAHRAQSHGVSISPNIGQLSPHLNNSPSPVAGIGSPTNLRRASPLRSPHSQTVGTPPINQIIPPTSKTHNRLSPPINFDQLPAPVQQLAQQVQRMPLPQPQATPSLPPGVNTLIHGGNYFSGRRPPMYSIHPPPPPPHYPPPPHLNQLYPPPLYGNSHYQQLSNPGIPQPPSHPPPPQLLSQVHHQMPTRSRYSAIHNSRVSRMPPSGPITRQRLKRPSHHLIPPQLQPQPQQQQQQQPQQQQQQPQQQQQQQQQQPQPQPQPQHVASKQRRMDVLLPDRNEDADCHIIAQQKRNDGLPVIQNVQGSVVQQTSNRSDSTIHLTDSITLSVRQPGSAPAQTQSQNSPSVKKSDAKAVANVLAARGITVTPAGGNKGKNNDQGKQGAIQQQQQQQQQQPQQQQQAQQQQLRQTSTQPVTQPANVTSLNLNSAISIIPASNSQRKQQEQQGQFVVPQTRSGKQNSNDVDRPPRPPTVDLTQDNTPQHQGNSDRRRSRMIKTMLTCQVCDKLFQNQEILTQHMASHRTPNKLLHKCNQCPAQYPTSQALLQHKQSYHNSNKEPITKTPTTATATIDSLGKNSGMELAIPVVDLKSQNVLNRLSSIGIQSYIPLSQLSAQTGGYFGLPIITIDGANSVANSSSSNLAALGATSILSLGPLKHLPPR